MSGPPMMPPASPANANDLSRLVAALARPTVFGAECERVSLLETHISCVLLTGRYAYKLKKPVNLGFLDFTTLAARKFYCEEELRLNRRLAPALYLDVVAITGSLDAPALGGGGPVLEYAVRMREFPQQALASRMLADGALTFAHIDALAATVAAFHGSVAVAGADAAFGSPEDIRGYALQNFAQIEPLLEDAADRTALAALRDWTESEFAARAATFGQRKREGFVRECHGDLHLGNIAEVDGELTVFDCIEFNDHLRWIDVMSEVAFVVMDLEDRRRPDLAHRFLNAYLEATGDYGGLAVLRFYLAYRGMVRAKVTSLRARQLGLGDDKSLLATEYRTYVALAQRYARPPRPALIVTHGVSGCGKTALTQAFVELTGAIRVRTDIERKRLHGLPARAKSGSAVGQGLYAADATQATYAHALSLARAIVDAGDIAIVDGTFLARRQRAAFRDFAAEREIPFAIVAFAATDATLRARIAERARRGTDASEADLAVLDHQLAMREPLAADEAAAVVTYDAEAPLDRARDPASWRALLARIGAADTAGGSATSGPRPPTDPGLLAKVAFLTRPDSYPERAGGVAVVETHMSWVFFADGEAWKLKKPVRYDYLDFSTEAARRRNCSEEVRLNRRLTQGVYVGIVPLSVDADGRMHLGQDGAVVDWLVRMRRLPADRMLDHAIRCNAVRDEDIRNVVGALTRFYRECPPVPMTPDAYRERLACGIADSRRELSAHKVLPELFEPACAQLLAMLETRQGLFDERVHAGRIVEGHGDLRPEHICLLPQPQIIDCLEFSREFRILDPVDELAFLALECERLGAPGLRRDLFDAYTAQSGDAPPDALVHFHQCQRACLRAKISLWHLRDTSPADASRWHAQAREYLRLAREHAEQCR